MSVKYIPQEFVTYAKRDDIVWYTITGDTDNNKVCGIETPVLYDPANPKNIMIGVHDTNGDMKYKNVYQLEYKKHDDIETYIYTDYFIAYVGDSTSLLEVKLTPVSKTDNKLPVVYEKHTDYHMFKGVKGAQGDQGIDAYESGNYTISKSEYLTYLKKYMHLAKSITGLEDKILETTMKSKEVTQVFEEIPIGTIVFSQNCPTPSNCWLEFGYSDITYDDEDYPELAAIVKSWGDSYVVSDTQFCLGDSADTNRYLVTANTDMMAGATQDSQLPNIDESMVKSYTVKFYAPKSISYGTGSSDCSDHNGFWRNHSYGYNSFSSSLTTSTGISTSEDNIIFNENVSQVYGNCLAINAWIKAKSIANSIETEENDEETAVYVLRINMANYPTKRSYYVGDTVDITGMSIQIINSDGTRVTLSEDEFEYTPKVISSTDDNCLYVTYKNYSCKCKLTITEIQLTQLAIQTYPDNINYSQGDYPDFTGMVVIGTYNNGAQEEITDYSWTPTYFVSTPIEYVTIEKDGCTDGFYVNVSEAVNETITLVCNQTEFYCDIGDELELIITVPIDISEYTADEVYDMFSIEYDSSSVFTYDSSNFYSVDYDNNTIIFTFIGNSTGTVDVQLTFFYEYNKYSYINATNTVTLSIGIEKYVKYTLTPYILIEDDTSTVRQIVKWDDSCLVSQNPSPLTLNTSYVQEMAESTVSKTFEDDLGGTFYYINTPNWQITYTYLNKEFTTTYSKIYFKREMDFTNTASSSSFSSAKLTIGTNTTISGYVDKTIMDDVYIYKYAKCTLTLSGSVNDYVLYTDTYVKTLSSSTVKNYLINDSYLSYNSGNTTISTGSFTGQTYGLSVWSTSLKAVWDTSNTLDYALYDSIKISVYHKGGLSNSSTDTTNNTKTLVCYAPIDQDKLS